MKERLISQRIDLLRSIKAHLHGGSETGELGLANHYAEVREQAEAGMMTSTDVGQLQGEMAELTQIDGALARIAAGVYGVCTRCGTPIKSRRLHAIPTAEMCMDCQMLLEQQRNHRPGAH